MLISALISNREIGLIIIGVEEMDEDTGEKAVPRRPVVGIDEALLETTENGIKGLLAEIHPRVSYHLLDITVDGRTCLVIAVEPGSDGPYETSARAEQDKGIRLKAGRYIRIRRDTRMPNKREEFELLKKFADFHFSSELNETDDYTMVTCPINEEFAHIRDHEDAATRTTPEKTTPKEGETTPNAQHTTANEGETTPISPATGGDRDRTQGAAMDDDMGCRIVALIEENPSMSARDMAEILGMTRDGVRYHLKKLTALGVIHHEGTARSGRWKVNKEDSDA